MRMLLGLWLVQGLTVLIALAALPQASAVEAALWTGVLAGIGAIGAFWICGALRDQRRLGEAKLSERMASRTAEMQAELAKTRAEEAARLRALTEKVGRPRGGLLKAGVLSGGALGLGVALFVTQFLTLAFLAVAFAGGGAAGYALRARTTRGRPIEIEGKAAYARRRPSLADALRPAARA